MSTDATLTSPPSSSATLAPELPPTSRGPREIKLVSHSPIFYWWPIWVLGYVMALITLFENHRLAIVPADSELVQIPSNELRPEERGDNKTRYRFTVPNPPTKMLVDAEAATLSARGESTAPQPFRTRVSIKAWMGPLYCVILILTILITNVPLRGLWSFLVILMLLVLALIISLVPGGWDDLLGALGHLHIFINMAGYLFIATTVLILWAVSVFIFDQRTYMIITPGQIRVCEHIGASIRNFDTTGLSFEKQRDDLFRHWILGFFSGDLIVRTHGAEKEEIRFPNVLWIGWRLEQVQEILREKATVVNP